MILQELNHYYERKRAEDDSDMPAYGTSVEGISFALIVRGDGTLQGITDLRDEEGKKLVPRKISVPAAVTRTSGIKANYLWDKSAYVLGVDGDGANEQNLLRFQSFRERLTEVGGILSDEGLLAVTKFLDSWDCKQTERIVSQHIQWEAVAGTNLVFGLDGERGFIHNRPNVQEAWQSYITKTEDIPRARCLITGEEDVPLARVHTPIKGVLGSQTSGGYIVSFNASAFISYERNKADVGERAAFAYTTALNFLLRKKSHQKIVISDTTVVFWAECRSAAEELFASLFNPNESGVDATAATTEDDQQTADKIFYLLKAIRAGRPAVDIVSDLDESVRFFILGLAPNASRLSIRFWLENTVGNLFACVGKHFRDLAIVPQFDRQPEFPSLRHLLAQTAVLGKSENIQPVLAGGITKAMLSGGHYPLSLLPVVLCRIRAEREVGYYRAALLKAFLVRNNQMEISMSYDPNRKDTPYLLGGLFAVLEKAQNDAIPGTNATIKDRFFASAPATPARIFPVLLKNAENHIAKLRKDPVKKGLSINLYKMLQETVADIDNFPHAMRLEEQALFMIGYYQRMKDFYISKKTTDTTPEEKQK